MAAYPPCLYTETRLHLDPSYSELTVAVSLPSTAAFSSSPKRSILRDSDSFANLGEAEFEKRHLASEASIFFRTKHGYPQSILWRLLEDRKVLELRSVDLSQARTTEDRAEAELTLRLTFPTAIRPFGIALAEPEEKNALAVYALTTGNELYSLMLHREFFVRPAATELDVREWCKISNIGSLGLRKPYRLMATCADELFVSTQDGGLLRLLKKTAHDDHAWRDFYYSNRSWGGSIRGLIPFRSHPTVRYGSVDLEPQAAVSMALSPDGKHLLAGCLDHTLKAWNLKTGKVGVDKDLLGTTHSNIQPESQYTIGPSQKQLMQVVDVFGEDGDLYYVVTYSPKSHEFKFWGMRDADEARNGIRDVHPDVSLVPPIDEILNTTVWNMEEFFVKAIPGWRGTELWVRARSGPHSRVFSLKFHLFDSQDLERAWKDDWVSVDSGSVAVDALRSCPDYPGDLNPQDPKFCLESVSDRWFEFLFFPARFTTSTLETALSIYQGNAGNRISASTASAALLKERIQSALTSRLPIPRTQSGIDYDRYEVDMAVEWQVFYGLVKDLHRRRCETLSFTFDASADLPWILHADAISAIRRCSEIELLSLNSDSLSAGELSSPLSKALRDDSSFAAGKILNAAHLLRSTYDPPFDQELKDAVTAELFQEPSISVPARIQAFEARCRLGAQLGDEEFERLTEALDGVGSFGGLDNDLFFAALEKLNEKQKGHSQQNDISRFGARALVRSAQETIQLGEDVLLDLLVLVVFVAHEIEPVELSPQFDPNALFKEILTQLKDYSILNWLVSHSRQEPGSHRRRSTPTSKQTEVEKAPVTLTVLESIFIGDWPDMLFPDGPLSSLLTYWCRAWLLGSLDVQKYELFSYHIMGNLLKTGNFDLAADFERYLQSRPWATYLRGRVCLARGDYVVAASHFKKCAYGLASSSEDHDTANLLDPTEKMCFSEGRPFYYKHIIDLFEKQKAYSYVAEFATLGLQTLAVTNKEDQETRTDLLGRLFIASKSTSRFDQAHAALVRYTNTALRKADLSRLIMTLVNTSQSSILLGLPFTTLQWDVDSILESLSQKTLNVETGPPYHKVLYAWRIKHGDFKGAAAVLYQQLCRQRATSAESEALIEAYLLLINCLESVGKDEAWILVEEDALAPMVKERDQSPKSMNGTKRRVLTVEDARREYAAELDRRAAMEHGRFAFGAAAGDDMDVL